MRIEDRLTNGGRRLRADVEASVSGDDVESALTGTAGTPSTPRWRSWPVLLAAAAVIVVAGAVGALAVGGDDERLVADEGETAPVPAPITTTAPTTAADIPGEVIGKISAVEEVGSIAYLGVQDALADQYLLAHAGPVPTVDFAQQAVLTFTTVHQCSGRLTGLDQAGQVLRPHFAPEDVCDLVDGYDTFFVAVDKADLPTTFEFVLDSELLDGEGPYSLTVDTSENFTSFSPPRPPPSGGNLVPGAPDLERPDPGREITFDRIGDVAVGEEIPLSEVQVYEGRPDCGYWGPGEPSHDGDEPLGGLVTIDGAVARVKSIDVRRNPRYRTASGVGVGTTLESLERIYGDDLVVDRADAAITPTEGLTGQYSDVAAVRNGERALTFYLHGDVVHTVKLSSADFWGDDEGCA